MMSIGSVKHWFALFRMGALQRDSQADARYFDRRSLLA